MTDTLKARTEQKLRFAKLHVDEFAAMPPGRGHDFERAHQEAVLAQLFGAYDAFLNELNVLLGCGRGENDISLGKLRESVKAKSRPSAVLRRLYELQEDDQSWFRQAQELRHITSHVAGLPLAYYVGGPESGKVALKHPRTMQEFPGAAVSTLSTWVVNMQDLIDELRELAEVEGAG